jgi:hypothetical protein
VARLEDFTPGARVRGVVPEGPVTVVHLEWQGDAEATLTYRDDRGQVGDQLIYLDNEPQLSLDRPGAACGSMAMVVSSIWSRSLKRDLDESRRRCTTTIPASTSFLRDLRTEEILLHRGTPGRGSSRRDHYEEPGVPMFRTLGLRGEAVMAVRWRTRLDEPGV